MAWIVSTSRDSTRSTVQLDDDPTHLYNATILDINFRALVDGTPVTIKNDTTVYDIIDQGPAAIMENNQPQLRWIHLPANNMAWVEDLMTSLHKEQTGQNAVISDEAQEITKFDGVLREDLWKKAFHGRNSKSIHSRFMMPLATRYSSTNPDGPDSDDSESAWHNANVVAMYMPYLHWESYNSWKERQQRIVRLKDLEIKGKTCNCLDKTSDHSSDSFRNEALLHRYLHHDSPLHDRRTLDQSYFYNLRNVAHHDEDQVIGLHTWNRADRQNTMRKMMMTDQLWMWVVDGKTIVTAFPQTSYGRENEADILLRILDNIPESVQQGTVKSMNGLIALIVDNCTGVFHRSDIQPDLAFFEFFADEIGAARTEVDRMFHDFREISQSVERLWTDANTSTTQMSRELHGLFSIKGEITLMEHVEKIVSDLDKIDFIYGQQEDILRGLVKCSKLGRGSSRSLTDLCDIVESRRKAWAGMAYTAKATHTSLHGLLDLKQRQAAVSEARTVRYQVEISAKQGRSIMLLTIFTIFFLPISVMATIFGMNATELVGKDGGKISVSTIGAIVLPTTVTLVLLALVLAFNELSRETFGAMCRSIYKKCMDLGAGRLRTLV